MKFILFLALSISATAFSQTNIIAAKSHGASKMADIRDSDNFGLPPETRTVTHVEYLKDDCLVETSEVSLFETRIDIDTICDHPFLKENSVDVDRIKAMYPDGTKFIDFDKLEKTDKKIEKQSKKDRKERKSNALLWLVTGGILVVGLLFSPRRNMVRS